MSLPESILNYDLKNVITKNRFKGLWRLMTGYHHKYVGAALSLGLAAAAKTSTYLLLRYFVDAYFVNNNATVSLPVIAFGFIGLAVFEGGFSFYSGKLAAETAEGSTKRLRDYLYDHIQHLTYSYHDKMQTGELIQRATSDVDALRRFFADQAIGVGRNHYLIFDKFCNDPYHQCKACFHFGHCGSNYRFNFHLVFQTCFQSL